MFLGDVGFSSNIAPVFGEVNDIYRMSDIDGPLTADSTLAAVNGGIYLANLLYSGYLAGSEEFFRHVFLSTTPSILIVRQASVRSTEVQ